MAHSSYIFLTSMFRHSRLRPVVAGRCRSEWGVTLVELMITVAIIAIVMTMSGSMYGMIERNRVTAYTNEFLTALARARNEAIMRGQRVAVCKSNNSQSANPACTVAGGWEQGWIIFVDVNNNLDNGTVEVSTGDTVLQVHGRLAGGVTMLSDTNTSTYNYISYSSDGRTRLTSGASQTGTISVCAAGSHSDTAANIAANYGKMKAIAINAAGRAGSVRTLTTTNVTCP